MGVSSPRHQLGICVRLTTARGDWPPLPTAVCMMMLLYKQSIFLCVMCSELCYSGYLLHQAGARKKHFTQPIGVWCTDRDM